MTKFRKLVGAAAASAAVTALFGAPGTAQAEPSAVLGGGSGIVVGGQNICTLTTIGRDNGGRLVGFTAAHCGDANAAIVPESDRGGGTVGTVVFASRELDYSVIEFDAGKVTPVNQVGGTTITGLGGPARPPDTVCKEGRTTGRTCGPAYGDMLTGGNSTWTQTCVVEGDSGAPLVVGTTLVGMVSGYLAVPCIGPQLGTDITAVVADVNARGGAGAGFQPI
ncbi:serine protease [Nocardia beijingensis]|uniref:serine protease n=1 Tax=Nocardia beijingensis TaxID=95162 RepID=UPI001893383B|nr:serine protease [Nocardia beijingensis]MBF6464275.1 serine protease [Nocardia beijingensis]